MLPYQSKLKLDESNYKLQFTLLDFTKKKLFVQKTFAYINTNFHEHKSAPTKQWWWTTAIFQQKVTLTKQGNNSHKRKIESYTTYYTPISQGWFSHVGTYNLNQIIFK
jgi:hypothetical protein